MLSYQNTPEQDIIIDLPDGAKIHGWLRGSLDDDVLAVMMHGRPGEANETLQYLGARYLYEQGISSLRLYMYDYAPEYRNLVDSLLDTHIADFDAVITYLRGKTKAKLFGVGHSYGGVTILGSSSRLDGAVMWDAAHGLTWQDKEAPWARETPPVFVDTYAIYPYGAGWLNSRENEEADETLGDTTDWARGKGYPIKFITAGRGILVPFAKRYYDVADEPKAFVEIKDASHPFDDSDEVMEQLFSETVEWIKTH